MLTLINSKKVTASELAEKYELSKRTIYRYIDVLNQAGVPIVSFSGSGGGIAVADNFKLDKTFFSKEEYSKIIAALTSFGEMTDEKETRLLIEKFKSMSQGREENYVLQSDRLFVDIPSFDAVKHKISVVQKALFEQKAVEIEYCSRYREITFRKILPHALAVKDGQWYVYAFCTSRNDFRLFKISRITKIVLTDESFERLQMPDVKKEEENLPPLEKVELTLKITDAALPDAEEWLGVENITKNTEGYFAKTTQYLNNELISKLLSFGDGVKILSPKKVSDTVRQKLKAALKTYDL